MEKKQEVTMACVGGIFICGVLTDGNKLVDPRMFSVLPPEEPKEGEEEDPGVRYHMGPPPGVPPYVTLGPDGFRYKVPDTPQGKIINDLYYRVTHPEKKVVEIPRGSVQAN